LSKALGFEEKSKALN